MREAHRQFVRKQWWRGGNSWPFLVHNRGWLRQRVPHSLPSEPLSQSRQISQMLPRLHLAFPDCLPDLSTLSSISICTGWVFNAQWLFLWHSKHCKFLPQLLPHCCGCLISSLGSRLLSPVWLLLSPGLQPTRLLCPWTFSGKNTGAGCHCLLQGIFLAQGSNPCPLQLLHWKADSLPTVPRRKPSFLHWAPKCVFSRPFTTCYKSHII